METVSLTSQRSVSLKGKYGNNLLKYTYKHKPITDQTHYLPLAHTEYLINFSAHEKTKQRHKHSHVEKLKPIFEKILRQHSGIIPLRKFLSKLNSMKVKKSEIKSEVKTYNLIGVNLIHSTKSSLRNRLFNFGTKRRKFSSIIGHVSDCRNFPMRQSNFNKNYELFRFLSSNINQSEINHSEERNIQKSKLKHSSNSSVKTNFLQKDPAASNLTQNFIFTLDWSEYSSYTHIPIDLIKVQQLKRRIKSRSASITKVTRMTRNKKFSVNKNKITSRSLLAIKRKKSRHSKEKLDRKLISKSKKRKLKVNIKKHKLLIIHFVTLIIVLVMQNNSTVKVPQSKRTYNSPVESDNQKMSKIGSSSSSSSVTSPDAQSSNLPTSQMNISHLAQNFDQVLFDSYEDDEFVRMYGVTKAEARNICKPPLPQRQVFDESLLDRNGNQAMPRPIVENKDLIAIQQQEIHELRMKLQLANNVMENLKQTSETPQFNSSSVNCQSPISSISNALAGTLTVVADTQPNSSNFFNSFGNVQRQAGCDEERIQEANEMNQNDGVFESDDDDEGDRYPTGPATQFIPSGEDELNFTVRPRDYPNSVINTDMMKTFRENMLINLETNQLNETRVTFKANHGIILTECRDKTVAKVVKDFVVLFDWERWNIPALVNVSQADINIAPYIEARTPSLELGFDHIIDHFRNKMRMNTRSWRYIHTINREFNKSILILVNNETITLFLENRDLGKFIASAAGGNTYIRIPAVIRQAFEKPNMNGNNNYPRKCSITKNSFLFYAKLKHQMMQQSNLHKQNVRRQQETWPLDLQTSEISNNEIKTSTNIELIVDSIRIYKQKREFTKATLKEENFKETEKHAIELNIKHNIYIFDEILNYIKTFELLKILSIVRSSMIKIIDKKNRKNNKGCKTLKRKNKSKSKNKCSKGEDHAIKIIKENILIEKSYDLLLLVSLNVMTSKYTHQLAIDIKKHWNNCGEISFKRLNGRQRMKADIKLVQKPTTIKSSNFNCTINMNHLRNANLRQISFYKIFKYQAKLVNLTKMSLSREWVQDKDHD